MTNDEQYVPSEDDVRIAYVDEWVAQSDFLTRHQEREAERAGEAAWDRFLARVRRDAAREALDGLIADKAHMTVLLHAETGGDVEGVLTNYRDTFHPEETP